MQAAQVIPFNFEACPVRTMLIDDQPWFVASDVAAALGYRMAGDMTRNLDEDERGTQIVRTPSRNQHGDFGDAEQEMLIINESGLYSAILRSRKAEAKRFKKWVTAEVLPAIRKHGRYEDSQGKMATLVDQTIGTDGFHILRELIGKKVKRLPLECQRSAKARLWSALHTRFNVPKTELIAAEDMAEACRFVAGWVEGEYLPASRAPAAELPDLSYPLARWRAENPHLKEAPGRPGVLGVSVMALNPMDTRSPTLQLLGQVEAAGFDVEACKVEFNAMRDHLDVLHGVLCTYQASMQTMAQRRFGYRLQGASHH